jgi:hypothetical protein
VGGGGGAGGIGRGSGSRGLIGWVGYGKGPVGAHMLCEPRRLHPRISVYVNSHERRGGNSGPPVDEVWRVGL